MGCDIDVSACASVQRTVAFQPPVNLVVGDLPSFRNRSRGKGRHRFPVGRFQQARFGLLRTVRLRLYPGDAATGILPTAIAGACRHVWNHLPADQERRYLLWKAYRIGSQPVPVCFTLYKRFTVLCHDPDHAWLKDHPFACVRHSLKYLGDAYTRHFN